MKERRVGESALRVYILLYLRAKDRMGIRQIQRALGFSSPSSVVFQLEKLQELGLVQRTSDGEYRLTRYEKLGILSDFVVLRGQLIPWMLVYAITINAFTLTFLVWFTFWGTLEVVLATLPSVLASMLMWIQARKVWKARPRFLDYQ
jgi:DNA-binding transcriptional ArsR family regulator